jgi:uncharacterized protein YegP (UPF0339 family)
MKIYIYPIPDDEWFFEIVSGGSVIASSRPYSRKADAKRAAKNLIKNIARAAIVEAE